MSNIHQLPDREGATAKACEWLARLERGLNRQENRELRKWLAANPANAAALIEAASLWDRMNSLSRLADLFPKPLPKQARQRRVTLAIAASVLVVLASGWFVWTRTEFATTSAQSQFHVAAASAYRQLFETAIGEHSTILLPDGSELTLNTNSRVRADFSGRARHLRLEKGEVYIKVARDESRPLIVWARDRVVQAIGTAFNVEIKVDQRIEVIVAEGKVMIGVAESAGQEFEPAWLEKINMPVVAGQRALLGQENPKIEQIDAEEIDVKLSWRNGNLVFRGEPLADALGEIERYTRVEFIIRDEELKSIRVAGLFRAGDVDGLLATLRENFNISYERIDPDTIVLKGE
jgi:transmembrane sensor